MPVLRDRERAKVQEKLAGLDRQVRMVSFTQELECDTCRDTHDLLDELARLSDRLTLEVHDFRADAAKAREMGIDKIPAVALLGERDPGVRFFGVPSGYELPTLLDGIRMIAAGDSGLAAATREKLRALDRDLHIQVFVTPT